MLNLERKVYMSKSFQQVVEERRSIYAIGKESPVSTDEIKNIVEHAVKYVPSSFNAQIGRVVILLGKQHDTLWEITREELRKIVPEGSFAATDDKINSFKNGHGTLLFFEDQAIVEGLQEQFALYKDNFPIWSLQSSGMLQFTIWAALEEAGLGASLQHYNPLIDEKVKSEWKIPDKWKLHAQMPFGKPLAPAGEKEFAPLDSRVKLYE
jgi:predicted oxidoreductase (fatty acid repression mutant protein)